MPYLGNTAGNRFVASKAATQHSGDGSTTVFPLDHAVGSDEDILVSVDGVIQEPSVAYAVSNGTTLTFTAAPSSNSGNNIFVYYLFRTVATVDHPSTSSLQATDGTFSGDIDVDGTTNLDVVDIDGAVDMASTLTVGGAFTSQGIDDNASSTVMTVSTGGFTLSPATNNLYQADGTLSYYGTTNNVYLNGAGSGGGLIISGDGTRAENIDVDAADNSIKFTTGTAVRMTIDSNGTATIANGLTLTDGNLVVASGHGIDFSATANSGGSMSSELLDDYEEGTWTPTWHAGFTSLSYGLQRASYTKVGNVVSLQADFKFTGTSAGVALILTGLPFTSGSTGNGFAAGSGTISYSTISTYANNSSPTLYVQQGNTYIYFYTSAGASVSSNSNASNDWLQFTAIYQTDS